MVQGEQYALERSANCRWRDLAERNKKDRRRENKTEREKQAPRTCQARSVLCFLCLFVAEFCDARLVAAGSHSLIGAAFGVAILLCNFYLANLVPQFLGYPPPMPWFDFPATQLLGIHSFGFGFMQQIFGALIQSFILLFILFLLYMIVRRERVAAIVLWVIATAALSLTHETPAGIPFALLTTLMVVWLLYRYGLLALISAIFILHLTIFYPVTSDFSAWYATDFVLALFICLALVVFGTYTSLAGQPLFRSSLFSDNV